jgi:hypothetical protein
MRGTKYSELSTEDSLSLIVPTRNGVSLCGAKNVGLGEYYPCPVGLEPCPPPKIQGRRC